MEIEIENMKTNKNNKNNVEKEWAINVLKSKDENPIKIKCETMQREVYKQTLQQRFQTNRNNNNMQILSRKLLKEFVECKGIRGSKVKCQTESEKVEKIKKQEDLVSSGRVAKKTIWTIKVTKSTTAVV